jgi:6-phosphofructokinase 1
MAVAGSNAVMPVIERISENPYQWRIAEAKLEDIANVEKVMPAAFIREDGFGITEACRRYIEPLIQGEAYPPYVDGLPGYRRLSVSTVARKLPAFEP